MESATGPYRGGPAARKGDPADIAREAIAQQIGPAERLLWTGRPRQGLHVRASDALASLGGLLLGGLSLYWEASAVELDWHPLALVLGVPFLVFSLYLLAGRLALDARRRSRLYYGVTEERVLILSDGGRPELRSIELDRPDDVVLHEEGDGSGTIVFGAPAPDPLAGDQRTLQDMRRGMLWFDPLDPHAPQKPVIHSLDRVASARAVYDRIREAQRDLRKAREASVIRV